MRGQVIILEGPRGGGKSSVAQALRHQIWGSTLINLTGFTDGGEAGFRKIEKYYRAWTELLRNLEGDYTLIFDRSFFSEQVYSKLYKDYDFTERYEHFCNQLCRITKETGADLYLFYLTVADPAELASRLNRDKAKLFDQVEESVQKSLEQQDGYDVLMADFKLHYGNRNGVHYEQIETTGRSIIDIRDHILRSVGR